MFLRMWDRVRALWREVRAAGWSPMVILGALAWAAVLGLLVQEDLGRQVLAGLRRGAGPPGADQAFVARVIDGDTLALADGRVVRVLGIDAPETSNPNLRGPQPFGHAATDRLAALVEGRAVALERDITDTDHYGRLLRHVWIDGALVGTTLAREGLAYALGIPPDTRHSDAIRHAEAEAKAAKRGIWSLPRPTPLAIFGTPP